MEAKNSKVEVTFTEQQPAKMDAVEDFLNKPHVSGQVKEPSEEERLIAEGYRILGTKGTRFAVGVNPTWIKGPKLDDGKKNPHFDDDERVVVEVDEWSEGDKDKNYQWWHDFLAESPRAFAYDVIVLDKQSVKMHCRSYLGCGGRSSRSARMQVEGRIAVKIRG